MESSPKNSRLSQGCAVGFVSVDVRTNFLLPVQRGGGMHACSQLCLYILSVLSSAAERERTRSAGLDMLEETI